MKLEVNFNRNRSEGQMLPSERKEMYYEVLAARPKNLLEIGTWLGGGSTYILSCAAYEYGGILHTIEINQTFHDHAVNLYKNKMTRLNEVIRFHLGEAEKVIHHIKDTISPLGFVLFDGKEDAEQTMREYDIVKDLLADDAIIACHDWKISKMAKLRPILESSPEWCQTVLMENTDTGFSMFRRVET